MNKGLETTVGVLAVVAIVATMLLVSTWIVMLTFGMLASVFNWPNLAISFWQSMAVVVALSVLGSFFRG